MMENLAGKMLSCDRNHRAVCLARLAELTRICISLQMFGLESPLAIWLLESSLTTRPLCGNIEFINHIPQMSSSCCVTPGEPCFPCLPSTQQEQGLQAKEPLMAGVPKENYFWKKIS